MVDAENPERAFSVIELVWALSLVLTLTGFIWNYYRDKSDIQNSLEALRTLRSLAEAEQSFFFRPRAGKEGDLLSACLLTTPPAPDANPTGLLRPWQDTSGNYAALGFLAPESTAFSYVIASKTGDLAGLCENPEQTTVKPGKAEISIIAIGNAAQNNSFSVKDRPASPFTLFGETCEPSRRHEKVLCPFDDCSSLRSYFQISLSASDLRQVTSSGLLVATLDTCPVTP